MSGPAMMLQARTRLKRWLVDGYCRGWLPMWLVTAAFRVFRLGAL